MSHCRRRIRRNENGKLRGHRQGRRGGDGFLRETYPKRLASAAWDIYENVGRSRQVRRCGYRGGEPVWVETLRGTTHRPDSLGRTYELGTWWRRHLSYNWPDRAIVLRIDFGLCRWLGFCYRG